MANSDNEGLPLWMKILYGTLALLFLILVIFLLTYSDNMMTILSGLS
jgi:hypothetical protein